MINLLPPQQLANVRIARANTALRRYVELLFIAILVIMAAILGAYSLLRIQQKNVQTVVDNDKTKIAKLEPVQKQATQLSETINTIASLSSRDVRFSSMLTKIGGLMPDGSVLTGLQVSVEDFASPLEITAETDSEAKAAVLLNNVTSSDLFKSAEIKMINRVEEKTNEQTTTTTTTDATAQPTAETPPASPYKYTVVINAYFKQATGARQ